MKANKSMISDWVLFNGDDKPYPVQVIEITSLKQLQVYNGKDWFIAGEKYFEPIPLTAEILEKNGFDCSDKEIIHLYFEDGDYKGYFALRAMYEKETGIQKGWGFLAFNVLVVLDYVHELQHALKLCGIDKEIVL